MTANRQTQLANLEAAFAKLPITHRIAILREVTEMFVSGVSTFSPDQVGAFDAIIKCLIKDVDPKSLIDLSSRLAVIDNAPVETIVRLSYDSNLSVAGPILKKSVMLADVDLISVAKTKGRGHRLAIACRQILRPVVTEVLVEFGEQAVIHKVIENAGAAFSENSFVKLVNQARKDQDLASLMARRTDVPAELQPFIKLAMV
jgi:uncharacterized protein (DUF2336 family)